MILKKIAQNFQNKKNVNKFVNEKLDEILKLSEQNYCGDLTYHFKGKTGSKSFNDLDNAFSFLKKDK